MYLKTIKTNTNTIERKMMDVDVGMMIDEK
jgi:hypothetical protein